MFKVGVGCSLKTSSFSIILLEKQILAPHPRSSELEILKVGPSDVNFNKPLWVILMHTEVWEPLGELPWSSG